MDPTVRELVDRLDDRLGRLSSQMDELHESVRQVVVVAEADPEMALTKARKVLESVLRRVWEHFIPNEPIGTRPLDEILQRLQKNGHLPRKQAAYAVAVKELGNVGTHVHDEKVDKADVVQALSPLISVLEWYFDQEWAEGAVSLNRGGATAAPARVGDREPVAPVTGPARRPRYLVRLAVGLAVGLMVMIIAGWFVMYRGGPVPPIAEAAPRSDQDRIQGRWQVFEGAHAKFQDFDYALDANKTVWTFRGTQLTISHPHPEFRSKEQVRDRGPFSLSQGVERKLFDFATKGPDGRPRELKGIYEFEGDSLRICYGLHIDPANNPEFKRPDSFVAGPGTRRFYLRFRRVGE